MTGPALGKVELRNAIIKVVTPSSEEVISNAKVYIHMKGFARARVTHIDVEHVKLNELVPPKAGGYYRILGVANGVLIDFSNLLPGLGIIIANDKLNKVIKEGEMSWCYVGGKPGGIYIGLRKHLISKLEDIIKEVCGV